VHGRAGTKPETPHLPTALTSATNFARWANRRCYTKGIGDANDLIPPTGNIWRTAGGGRPSWASPLENLWAEAHLRLSSGNSRTMGLDDMRVTSM